MRKSIFILFVSLLLCACNNTSNDVTIQKEILGIKIGKTSKGNALQILKEQGFDMKHYDRDVYGYPNNVRFGNTIWNGLGFYTFNDKVRKIYFVKYNPNYDKLLEELDNTAKFLIDKYKPLYVSDVIETIDQEKTPNYRYVFQDHEITLEYGLNLNQQTELIMELVYTNNELENQYNNYDEL